MEIHYLLITDGSSDRALFEIINWTFKQIEPHIALHGEWAKLQRAYKKLEKRIELCSRLYEKKDIYFIHRDAEKEPRKNRVAEIQKAMGTIDNSQPYVCIIPVRMTEAWLLFHEKAIRHAVGNPNGKMPLALPSLKKMETLSDPKAALHDLLRTASGRHGRRLDALGVSHITSRIPHFIEDFSPLRNLPAFNLFEKDLQALYKSLYRMDNENNHHHRQ